MYRKVFFLGGESSPCVYMGNFVGSGVWTGPDAEADFVAFCDSFCGWLMGVLAPPDVEVDLGLCAVDFVYVDSE